MVWIQRQAGCVATAHHAAAFQALLVRVVAALAQRLQRAAVELLGVAAVRLDVVGDRGQAGDAELQADGTQRLVLQLLGEMLGADHHTVDTVADGTQALEQLRRASYDLILSDVRMPYLDGPGLYRALERRRPELCRRFVLMTGDVLSAEIQTFLEQTGVPGLSKPFDRSEVRRVIQLAAGERQPSEQKV